MRDKFKEIVSPSNWRTIQSFLSSPLSKLGIAMPVAGYSILLSDFFGDLWTFQTAGIEFSSWRPVCVYFGFVLLLFAQIISVLWNDRITRKYASAGDFAEQEGATLWSTSQLKELVNAAGETFHPQRTGEDISLTIKFNAGVLFAALDKKNLVAARWCSLFIVTGAVLLAIPAIDLFFRVLNSVIVDVFS